MTWQVGARTDGRNGRAFFRAHFDHEHLVDQLIDRLISYPINQAAYVEILVIGAGGMIGSTVYRVLSDCDGLHCWGTVRDASTSDSSLRDGLSNDRDANQNL